MSVFDEVARLELAQHLRCQPENILAEVELIDQAIAKLRRRKALPGKRIKEECRQLRSRADRLTTAAKDLRASAQVGPLTVFEQDRWPTTLDMERATSTLEWTAGFLRVVARSTNYRDLHGLPSGEGKPNRLKAETAVLWPILEVVWLRRRGKPTSTADGPFFRYVKYVHECAGLTKPRHGTLRSALRRSDLARARVRESLDNLARLYGPTE